MHILFVCTGNICRSPIAERLARAHATRIGMLQLKFSSAGTRAVVGRPMHASAARVVRALGGDAETFVARQLTKKVAEEADLILTMTRNHREQALEVAPRMMRRTLTLSEAVLLSRLDRTAGVEGLVPLRPALSSSEVHDIADPIGEGDDTFDAVGAQIAELLPPIVEVCRRSSSR